MVLKLKVKPFDYQLDAAKFAFKRASSILSLATGSGKTVISILEAIISLSTHKVDKVVQICTKKSKISYKNDYENLTEIELGEDLTVINYSEDLIDFMQHPNIKIAVVQYETFKSIDEYLWVNLFKNHKTLVQIDEYHKCKAPVLELYLDDCNILCQHSVKKPPEIVTRLWHLRSFITCLTGYTATPISRDINDAFWLGILAKPGLFANNSLLQFYTNFLDFRAYKIPIKKGSPFKRTVIDVLGLKNESILKSLLDSVTYYYFPPKDINFVKVNYEPLSVRVNYEKAVNGMLDIYNERKINDATGVKEDKTFSARMLDIQYVLNNSEEKKQALMNTLKDTLSHGVLIYASYYETVDAIKEVLDKCRIGYQEITGKSTDRQCEKVMDWFNSNPENKVVILTAAGSQSINLQATDNFIFYDIPFTASGLIQALGRICRVGSKYNRFNCYIIYSKDTLDEYKYLYLSSNQEVLSYLQGNNTLYVTDLKGRNTQVLRMLRKQKVWANNIN